MSYPVFIKSLPETLRQKLKQPVWISAIASVGIHGILWIVLPLMPSASQEIEEPEIPEPVGLIELSPFEQARLPDFSTPSLELPPLATDPFAAPPPDLYSLDPFPNSFSTTPAQPAVPLDPFFLNPPPPPPPIVPRINQPPQTTQRPSPSPSPSPSPTRRQPLAGETTEVPDLAALGEESPTPAPPARSPEEITQALLQEQEQLQALLQYNEEGTGVDAARQSYTSWFEVAVQWLGDNWNGENAPEVSITAPYPTAACPNQLEGATIIGALVDPEGKAVEEPAPQILRRSGYGLFDLQAIELVKIYEFEQTGEPEAYRVNVKFEYNADHCPAALEAPPSPND